MYALGATPERFVVVGWSGPAGAVVPLSPAAMPATCVPCGSVGSNAFFPAASVTGAGKLRATMTFGVVFDPSPFGKPDGYAYPSGLRNGLFLSTPVSTTPILTPSPRAPVAVWSASAWMTDGPRSIVAA
jgi:hypothetical protein